LPERVEATGEVVALGLEDREPLAISLGMTFGNGCGAGAAIKFFASVKDLEREDREAIDHEAGGLRVEWGLGIGEAGRSELGKEDAVELFSEIVAALIGGVDATLYIGEDRVGGAGGAGFVFDVPEPEVGAVLGSDEGEPGV
jgi:hypothetical protein